MKGKIVFYTARIPEDPPMCQHVFFIKHFNKINNIQDLKNLAYGIWHDNPELREEVRAFMSTHYPDASLVVAGLGLQTSYNNPARYPITLYIWED